MQSHETDQFKLKAGNLTWYRMLLHAFSITNIDAILLDT